MACACGLNGSLIIDVGTGSERRSKPQRSPGLSVLFSIEVTEADATDALNITILHKTSEDTAWSEAGSFSAITSTGVYTKHITSLKPLHYWRYKCDDGKYVINSPTAQKLA